MKLIRWVELHIGRSRKRAKKTAQQESPGFPTESSLLLSHANLDVEPREGNHLPGHIRTRFQGLASPARQRSRIKTNPWIAQSPRSSADSSKERAPRGDRWSSEVGSLRSRAATDHVSDLQVPESECHARRLVTGISGSSDDEAYSEDFLQSEDSSDAVATFGTSQTDSACGSSCITTPLSECSSQLTETLADKVRRLQVHRAMVEEKMHEARVEEQASRHQRMRFHRELMQFRRLELLHSLQELRSDLEQRAAFENT
ncbi:hypothetical protein HPB50_018444 [Hyalomma asiaticum]|uniref:Uncharacterized protein n=1 Tax=Hyalomma asiaticum TaxID=266040 RepID=A0ACB7S2J1_HYAAI|nr:hypothetical protein HPB50_018444 [Hyalomma asiaticum]